jgi:mannose-P-dolichol utilization defect 1
MNYLLGSLSRIYTTLQEVNDKLILYGFVAGFALNLVLALQVIWYWNSPASKKTPATKVKAGKGGKGGRITAEKVNAGQSTSYSQAAKGKSPSTRRRG